MAISLHPAFANALPLAHSSTAIPTPTSISTRPSHYFQSSCTSHRRPIIAAVQPTSQQYQQEQEPQSRSQSTLQENPTPTISAPSDIVLTHATADFDSLAAAVGLAKLRGPHCKVVLPAGTHPSVRRYLSLHKSFFPIIDAKVVDPTALRWIAIVDTASPARLGPAASWLPLAETVVVVDHHDVPSSITPSGSSGTSAVSSPASSGTTNSSATSLIRQDLSALVTGDLELILEPVGAATTLVVERLQARSDLTLSRAEATLLALAIHTDTGSLTFENTTPRDAHALAWLLSVGACQRSISQFARHYLDAAQQRLLTSVLDGLAPQRVNGHSVAAPILHVDSFVHGMAVVAQTALDLAGLDALVLAVVSPAGRRKKQQQRQQSGEGEKKVNTKNESVQISLIGRAKARAEGVHFGELFSPLGGGGHAKAGSASLRVASVNEVDDIVDTVMEAMVGQLPMPMLARDFMSTEVVCIGLDESMEHARDALFASGHTGLAVVQAGDGKEVAGVVSRQDVALAERKGLLHTPVKGWIARKVITVTPDTPLHVIEGKLVDNEIGRVPVVEDGVVIGIVTRSDVLLQRRLCSPENH